MIFEVNEYGVCLNPNSLLFETEKIKCEIKTALLNNKWYYAIDFDTNTEGMHSPLMQLGNNFETENETINFAKNELANILKNKNNDDYKSIIKIILPSEQITFF